MPIATFAAIDVGSNELSLKIFEVSKKYGIKELDSVRHIIELGSETYTNGYISYSLVNELCEVLNQFNLKLQEYQVSDYTACATSAIREASNNALILDQIKLRCGIKVKILSNSEQRFLCYKAIALKESSFERIITKETAIVDVGAGSIQLSLFNKKSLVSTQNIKLGSLRIRELLADMETKTSNFNDLISEYIDNYIRTYSSFFLREHKIKNIIAVGDYVNEIYHSQLKKQTNDSISKEEFELLYYYLRSNSIYSICKQFNIAKEQAAVLLPTAMIYHKMFEITNAENMWIPGITLCDGLVAEYAEKKEKIMPSHLFIDDIIVSARNIAKKYECNIEHSSTVETIALSIFDSIRKLHGLGKRERLLLQISVILHSCGTFINMNEVAKNSYNIVMSTEIIGISHIERELIANIVRYHISDFPKYEKIMNGLEKDMYIKMAKLCSILMISHAMDVSHKQKFSNIKLVLKDNLLHITTETIKDITLEQGLFEEKANFFEQVYGIRPILKQKR